MSNNTVVANCLYLAAKLHTNQYDKAGMPYILHPIRVAEACVDPTAKAAAYLHDVLEDTYATVDTLRENGVSEDVIVIVVAMTKIQGEPYREYLDRIRNCFWAKEVKLADMSDNLLPWRVRNLSIEKKIRLAAKYARGRHYILTGEWHTTPELEEVIKAGANK